MPLEWSHVKEAFFAAGSIAGLLAIFKPVFEGKFQRDLDRSKGIISLLDEQRVIELEGWIYLHRKVRESHFSSFDLLIHAVQNNQDSIRFSGPLKKYYKRELSNILSTYKDLRGFVQVPEWEPVSQSHEDGTTEEHWAFNKKAFFDKELGAPRDYAKHLYDAAESAQKIKRSFQRFQIISEMHLLEAPLAKWLLPRRFQEIDLQLNVRNAKSS
jgi:hypothetical protein